MFFWGGKKKRHHTIHGKQIHGNKPEAHSWTYENVQHRADLLWGAGADCRLSPTHAKLKLGKSLNSKLKACSARRQHSTAWTCSVFISSLFSFDQMQRSRISGVWYQSGTHGKKHGGHEDIIVPPTECLGGDNRTNEKPHEQKATQKTWRTK